MGTEGEKRESFASAEFVVGLYCCYREREREREREKNEIEEREIE